MSGWGFEMKINISPNDAHREIVRIGEDAISRTIDDVKNVFGRLAMISLHLRRCTNALKDEHERRFIERISVDFESALTSVDLCIDVPTQHCSLGFYQAAELSRVALAECNDVINWSSGIVNEKDQAIVALTAERKTLQQKVERLSEHQLHKNVTF